MKAHICVFVLYCTFYSAAAFKAAPHFFSFGKAAYTHTGIAEHSVLVEKCLATSAYPLTSADSWNEILGVYSARMVIGLPWVIVAALVCLAGLRTFHIAVGLMNGLLLAARTSTRRNSHVSPGQS